MLSHLQLFPFLPVFTRFLSAIYFNQCSLFVQKKQALICLVDKKTGDKSKSRPRFVKQDQVAIMRIECSGMICLEQYKLFQQMGRFTLRDESKFNDQSIQRESSPNSLLSFLDKTIAIGKVLKVIE